MPSNEADGFGWEYFEFGSDEERNEFYAEAGMIDEASAVVKETKCKLKQNCLR